MSVLPETKKKQQNKALVYLFFFCFLGFAPELLAQDLLLFPKRIVFEGTQDRVQTIHLTNRGQDTTTFRISYTQTRMLPNGKIETIKEPDAGQKFADPYLRVFPRTVTIAPSKSQLVKIQLTKTGELEEGEYRSHLYFRPIPKAKPKEKNDVPSESNFLKIDITPVYGYAVANIIKIGESTTQVRISDMAFEFAENGPEVHMDFHRSGNMSSYGHLSVKHISPEGKETEVAISKGFGIYSPGNLRKASIPLKEVEGIDYSQGSLLVTYSSAGTGKEILAEATLNL